VFNQVREDVNPEQVALQTSIDSEGLYNGSDIVRLSRSGVQEYADFIGDLWGEPTDVASLPQSAEAPGSYDTLVAGHSRYHAMWTLAHEYAAQQETWGRQQFGPGYKKHPGFNLFVPSEARADFKLHPATSPMDMLTIQINENIHKAPAQERVAMAIVETYFMGFKNGDWHSQKEYQLLNAGKLTPNLVSSAMAFAKLPAKVRDLVFSKVIKYGVGVELGNFAQVVYDFYEHGHFDSKKRKELDIDERRELDEMVESRLMVEAVGVIQRGINVSAARMRFKSLREHMLGEIQGEKPQMDLLEMLEVDVEKERKAEIRRNKDLLKRSVDEMLGQKSAALFATAKLVQEYTEHQGDDQTLNLFIEGTTQMLARARTLVG
jgi:hypothetical protein